MSVAGILPAIRRRDAFDTAIANPSPGSGGSLRWTLPLRNFLFTLPQSCHTPQALDGQRNLRPLPPEPPRLPGREATKRRSPAIL